MLVHLVFEHFTENFPIPMWSPNIEINLKPNWPCLITNTTASEPKKRKLQIYIEKILQHRLQWSIHISYIFPSRYFQKEKSFMGRGNVGQDWGGGGRRVHLDNLEKKLFVHIYQYLYMLNATFISPNLVGYSLTSSTISAFLTIASNWRPNPHSNLVQYLESED